MGSFLISEVRGVRLAGNPRSGAPHDRLEFRDIVRGWQPEERQKWISELLENQGQGRECKDEVLLERLLSAKKCPPHASPNPMVDSDIGASDSTSGRGGDDGF